MALAKDGYRDAQQLTTKVAVAVTDDGKIATDSGDATGTKTLSITRANAANGLTDNNKLFKFFVDMIGGTIIETSNTATVKWQV